MIADSDLVLVAGATGGVGQLVVAKLLEKNIAVRVLTRNQAKAQQMFDNRVEIAIGDTRDRDTLTTATSNITQIICCTGTTAFPSPKWDFVGLFEAKNSPQEVDNEGVRNLLDAASDLKRFVFVSSCGVLRKDQFPFNLLNAFGVLDAKLAAEKAISASFPYTIIRPGRLIDGPYTSYDLNTLLRAKTDSNKAVVIALGDDLNGEASRIDVASACVECLFSPVTERKAFSIINSGNRPPSTDWQALFAQLA